MASRIKESLYQQYIHLRDETHNNFGYKEFTNTINNNSQDEILNQAVLITNKLKRHPYLPAQKVEQETGISLKNISLIYKLIQSSEAVQESMKESENRDYFNVVNHYFNNSLFSVVFFVGTTCPSKCVYCPNVTIDKKGKRKLTGYGKNEESQLKRDHIQKAFNHLEILKSAGTDILVKISGGLEPLTDTKTMSWITESAREKNISVKLFTNGILLNSKKRRNIALEANDIRISLSTADEDQYQSICFDQSESRGKVKALKVLKKSVRALAAERDRTNRYCKIGFNSIILPSNLDQLTRLIDLAISLEIDYIDFKPDYFSAYDPETELRIQTAVNHAVDYAKTMCGNHLYINFTDSLNKNNFYWKEWKGICDSTKQLGYKIFITPYGDCTPVHYGAFPHADASRESLSQYTIGQINDLCSLSDILDNPSQHPEITLKQLNPFELMLSLEITRKKEDQNWGIPQFCNPYSD